MSYVERFEAVEPEHARHFVARARDLLDSLYEIQGEEAFERRRNLLAIAGFPIARDEEELQTIIQTLRKAVYPGRNGGIH